MYLSKGEAPAVLQITMLFRLQWKEFQLARRKYPVQDIGPEMVGYRRVGALVRCLPREIGTCYWTHCLEYTESQRYGNLPSQREESCTLYRGPTACPGAMPGISFPP